MALDKPFRKVISLDDIAQLKKHPTNIVEKQIKCIQFEYEDKLITIFDSVHTDIFIVIEQEPYDTEPSCEGMSSDQISDMYGEDISKLLKGLL